MALTSFLLWTLFTISTTLCFETPPRPGPYKIYKTEPDFLPSVINVTKIPDDRSQLDNGYIFIAPHVGSKGWGPQIVDNDGELVWYGQPSVTRMQGHWVYGSNFRPCDFQGETNHLCYSEARPDGPDLGDHATSHNRVMNNKYEVVGKDYSQTGVWTHPNPHEFHMLPGGQSFLQSVYERRVADLRPYKGKKKGYIHDGCFQEVDTKTGGQIFGWCLSHHYELWEGWVYLDIPQNTVNMSSGVGGQGTHDNPWDLMHLNSVDKNEEGDYLVSGRHLSQILKIAGSNAREIHGVEPGTTLWRFNGRHSDIETTHPTKVGKQHHATFLSTTKNETIFSIFDNFGEAGYTRKMHGSTNAKIIKVNNATNTSELLNSYPSPYGPRTISGSQGSTQILPNGNVFVGWGSRAGYSEFTHNGTLLYDALPYVDNPEENKLTNYRAFRYPFVGNPQTKPKMVAYCQTCNSFSTSSRNSTRGEEHSPLIAYVSWNGATEVRGWRFHLSANGPQGPWLTAGTYEREGFETKAVLNSTIFAKAASFADFVSVEALDKDGDVLGSTISKTFVPRKSFLKNLKCDAEHCFRPPRFTYPEKWSRSDVCGRSIIPQVVILVLIVVSMEIMDLCLTPLLLKDTLFGLLRSGNGRRRWSIGSVEVGIGDKFVDSDEDPIALSPQKVGSGKLG